MGIGAFILILAILYTSPQPEALEQRIAGRMDATLFPALLTIILRFGGSLSAESSGRLFFPNGLRWKPYRNPLAQRLAQTLVSLLADPHSGWTATTQTSGTTASHQHLACRFRRTFSDWNFSVFYRLATHATHSW